MINQQLLKIFAPNFVHLFDRVYCVLICCFSPKLLDVYEIGIMPNFMFEFCICTS